MNDEGALHRRPRHQLSRRFEVSTGAGLTPLQDWLITLYLLIEDAQEELDPEGWRAFVWIACDRIGDEAAQLVVREGLKATEDAA